MKQLNDVLHRPLQGPMKLIASAEHTLTTAIKV
jgi:hypothetical protein